MKGTGLILNGGLILDRNVQQFLAENHDEEIDIEIIVLKKPEHFLYKYLWGYLMEDMAKFMCEPRDVIHDQMKEMFAKAFVDDWSEVPRRHRKKCQRFEIVHDNGATEKYYIKSTSSMTHEELKEYVQRVEFHYYDFLNGNSADNENTKLGYHLRVKGMMDQKELKKQLAKEKA